jgi:hypothetical protein
MNNLLITEVRRLRSLMELRNNEVKVRMQKGVPYRDITMPLVGTQAVFNGDELGVVVNTERNLDDQIQVALDDGRVVMTTDDAVADTSVGQDINSIEANDINDSGMNNSLGGAH